MNQCDLAMGVERALEEYFKDLDGQPPHAVYDMVLQCVEKPMLIHILKRAGGNQSKAAEILGLNRNTLRKKLQQYKIE
ncbi:MAG TPA: helix-turn-helix domain-containing protein [Methylophilaceae bacterium]|nr:helix-turn-helix domain-containing protein [Methylophilaceae bacterium]HSI29096.1 helix-turn-helix domain-containing protein [Methylophilus sp.]